MIKLSKKWLYALKAVIYIAKNNNNLVKIKDISKKEDISETLLRRLIADLEKTDVLQTVKWRSWGIRLAKKSELITIYDILDSIWEELWLSDCSKWLGCDNINTCSTTTLIWNLQKWFNAIIKLYTLDKVIKNDTII